MAGPGLVFIAYPKAITQMPLAPLLLHFFYGRSWSCFHRLSKGYQTDDTNTITVTLFYGRSWSCFHCLSKGYHIDAVTTITVTLLLWQVLALFSSPIQRLLHRCHQHHYCSTSFMAGPGLFLLPIQRLSHRCRYHHYCYTSFMAGPGHVFTAHPKAIRQLPLAPLLVLLFS